MQRQAFMSPVQGNIGENPQIQCFNYKEGSPMMMHSARKSSKSICTKWSTISSTIWSGKVTYWSSGRQSNSIARQWQIFGSETSSANTAVQQQSSRAAKLFTHSLGNYLDKSPHQVRYAMTAQVCGQPAYIAMTDIQVVGASTLSHSNGSANGGKEYLQS
jgi:hypothetical protein